MIEHLFRNAMVIDGSGRSAWRGDVAVSAGRISALGPGLAETAETEHDLDGLVLAPGFIDIHTHTDYIQFAEPRSLSKLRDGVTTEVSGNCGFSAFPLSEELRRREQERWAPLGIQVDWTDFRGYKQRLEARRTGINRLFYVGHGFLRACVLGHANRRATEVEMAKMKQLLGREMDAGAIGLSTGLIYPPGCYAKREELAELCGVVAKKGGLYASHMRGEGATLLDALEETLWICQESGARTQLSHLKASRPENWPKLDRAFAMIEYARSEGLPVMADRYPYDATSTGLDQLLPDWAYEGGVEAELTRLQDPAAIEKIRESMAKRFDDDYYGRVLIAGAEGHPELDGRRLTEVAAERGTDPASAAVQVLLETRGQCECVFFVLSEQNMRRVLAKDYVMVASDAESRAIEGPASAGKPHPRAYGTFARVLGRLSRDEGLLPLEEAIHKMTALPARQLGLADRGLVAPGFVADLTVFDPARVLDRATYVEPHHYSDGIVHVMVGGRFVLQNGEVTEELPGRVLSPRILPK
jgi:N-acyl-D-amino-acid deacylase